MSATLYRLCPEHLSKLWDSDDTQRRLLRNKGRWPLLPTSLSKVGVLLLPYKLTTSRADAQSAASLLGEPKKSKRPLLNYSLNLQPSIMPKTSN